ncbi:hypothetical protein KIS4809_3495 [Bacillus sp. ZZV12-4809]|nr:hypothetical protein KIS4809_3495 [Bacillus sp. ZZV12-4809]
MNYPIKKPYEVLTKIGSSYELTILEEVCTAGNKTFVIKGELRGWEHDDGALYAVIWEHGESRGEPYHIDDILAVSPLRSMFFTPYKGRSVTAGQLVDCYRNLHTDNGYSIRCAKTGLVLAHCSTVQLKNAKFVVSEGGRQKTVQEKRRRVHAYIRGELVSYNEHVPMGFKKVLYNPYHTPLFTDEKTNKPIYNAEDVFCSGKYAYYSGGENDAYSISEMDDQDQGQLSLCF